MKAKPKILRPTLRTRKRYVVFKVVSESRLSFEDVSNAIYGSLLEFGGELNTALAKLRIMRDLWQEEKQAGVLRCSHTAVELVRASMLLIDRIGDSRVAFRVLGVSGTVRGAKRKFLEQKMLEDF